MNKILLFGAGKIGRSFIAQLFSRSGYEIVFVDINQKLIDLLNKADSYKVVVKDKKEYSLEVRNFRAIHFSEKKKILEVFADTSLVSTSVGANELNRLFPLFAEALVYRFKKSPYSPVDFIIAENLRNADDLFEKNLKSWLPDDYPFDKLVGLVETSIGKMVPIMSQQDITEDPLQVFAEDYNKLPISAKGFKNSPPEVAGLKYKSNIKVWVDRKSLIHNLGHAAAAYFGFQAMPDEKFLWKVLGNKEVFEKTQATMQQSAHLLLMKYPYDFTQEFLEKHVDDLLSRFQNKALGDTVFRVGSDLHRKLSSEDRLSSAIKLASVLKQPYDLILEALVAGFYFRARDMNNELFPLDKEFAQKFEEQNFEDFFAEITGFNRNFNSEIIDKAVQVSGSMESHFGNS